MPSAEHGSVVYCVTCHREVLLLTLGGVVRVREHRWIGTGYVCTRCLCTKKCA